MELKVLSCSDDFPSSFSAAFLCLLSLHTPPSHSLFFHYSSLLSLTAHFPVPFSPCSLHHSRVLLLAVMHERDPILEALCRDAFPAESQDGFQGRLKTLFLLHNQTVGSIPQNMLQIFIMWLVSWWLTKPVF